jgi:hypothetical protein
MQNLLLAYDQSTQHKLMPVKSATDEDEREYLYERASQYGDENIKIVRIQKTADPLVSLFFLAVSYQCTWLFRQ